MNQGIILFSLGMLTVIVGTCLAFIIDNTKSLRPTLIYFVGLLTGVISTILIVLSALTKP